MASEKECLRAEAGRFLREEDEKVKRSLRYEEVPQLQEMRETQEELRI